MDHAAYYEMKFLENFIEFGALHRVRTCWNLLSQFEVLSDEDENLKGSIALAITESFLNSHEDLALWLQALDEWVGPNTPHILKALEAARFSSGSFYLDVKHLKKIAKLGVASGRDLAARFQLPYDERSDWAWVRPEAKVWIREELDRLATILYRFFYDALYLRRGTSELILWKAWNKSKHGARVMLTRNSSLGPLVTIRLDPDDPKESFHVRARSREIRLLVAKTMLGNVFLGRLLNLLFQKRYGQPPDVSWIELSLELNTQSLSRATMSSVLQSSRIPRQDLAIEPKSLAMLVDYCPSDIQLADDW